MRRPGVKALILRHSVAALSGASEIEKECRRGLPLAPHHPATYISFDICTAPDQLLRRRHMFPGPERSWRPSPTSDVPLFRA